MKKEKMTAKDVLNFASRKKALEKKGYIFINGKGYCRVNDRMGNYIGDYPSVIKAVTEVSKLESIITLGTSRDL